VWFTARPFTAYGTSHWTVLALAVAGVAGFVLLGRRAEDRVSRRCGLLLGTVIALVNLGVELWLLRPSALPETLPLHLSDLAPYVAAYALWTRRPGACALTYYWGLTLSTQSLLTPVLAGPDFPGLLFLGFFADHALVVWAAVFLTWGLGHRPSWRGYRLTVLITGCWAVAVLAFNAAAGTNYGFLNAKPATPSLLDLLGPWPWYLVSEALLVLVGWALITLPWERSHALAPARAPD
jgi:hypothetical integral membrane protein (TIGR02206 family)